MQFEWDEVKNQANIRKHGISFETAKRIFEGPVVTRIDQRKDYGEDRYISIGRVEPAALIVVAHTSRNGRIRLISARPASRKERQAYHEQIR
ncbi:MAG: BrnT family toxin [Desulfurellaceae bacterium]|nr:BrnT family toxin [Desulfurellaceae bacterium]